MFAKVAVTMGCIRIAMMDMNRLMMMRMIISCYIETVMMMVSAMQSMICMIACWHSIIEIMMVVIDIIDSECPPTTNSINRTEKVIKANEYAELRSVQNITKVLISVIKIVIVGVNGI